MNQKKLFYLGILLMSLHLASSAHAVTASGTVHQIKQPDGNIIEVVQRGDERTRWVETIDGYSIAKGPDKSWYYVQHYDNKKPLLSTLLAHQTAPPTLTQNIIPKHLLLIGEGFDASQLRKGLLDTNTLIILVEYNDTPATYTDVSSWAAKIVDNQDPNAKSIADYYDQASYGAVAISPAFETHATVDDGVIGWLRIDKPHPNPQAFAELIPPREDLETLAKYEIFTDAIAAADPYIEYALYDTNGDTAIDASELAIIVVVAGHEASTSGTLYGASVWAHANLGIAETNDFVTETSCETICEPMPVNVTSKPGYTGPTEICYEECETTTHSIWVVGAAEMGEIHDNDHQATLGVMVHELGHTIFGLPDLYDRDGTSSGIGGFGLMAAGSWGQDVMVDTYSGETPVLPTAWSQYKLQWIDAKISVNIVATGRNSLPALKPTVGRATAGVSWFNGVVSACSGTEYFLMQYRANIGYDRGLNRFLDPLGGNFQAGVVVYHVNESVDHNDWDSKRLVDVEEANGTAMGTGTGFNDQLWYQGNFTLFNSATTPASNTYSGVDSGVALEVLNNYVTTTGQEAVYVDIESQCDVSKFAMFQSPFP